MGSVFWGRLLGCAYSYIAPLVRAVPLFEAVSASIEAKGKGGARGEGGEGREEAVIKEQRNLPFLLLLFGGGWVSRGKKEARGDLFP